MKLKKLLAAVTAAALAVTTMAVTSFTASAAITNENGSSLEPEWGSGKYLVKYGNDLSKAQWKECYGISFNVSFADGVGESFGGKLSHSSISSYSLEYNNSNATISGDSAVISHKSSSPLDADGEWYNTWSCFIFESYWGNDMTVDSYTYLDKDGNDLKQTFVPPAAATKYTKVSAGKYTFSSIDKPNGVTDNGSNEIAPEDEMIPVSDLLPAGKTAADVRKITITTSVGQYQYANGKIAIDSLEAEWNTGDSTASIETPNGVTAANITLQTWYMNYSTDLEVTVTVECAEGGDEGKFEITVNPGEKTIAKGEDFTVTVLVTGTTPELENVEGSMQATYDDAIVSVDDGTDTDDGMVYTITGVAAGTTTVDFEWTPKDYELETPLTVSCDVTVTEGTTPPAVAVTVTPATAKIKVGETIKLTAAVTGKDDAVVTWEANKDQAGDVVVEVAADGTVTGKKAGAVEVWALVDGKRIDSNTSFCVVTVEAAEDPKPPVTGDKTHTGSADITAANDWGSVKLTEEQLLGGLDPKKTTITFTGTGYVKIGYNSLSLPESNSYTGIDSNSGTVVLDCSDLRTGEHFFCEIGASNSQKVTWVATEKGSGGEDPKPDDPNPPVHTHTPATVWSSDATGHWHACSGCNEKLDFAAHTSDGGKVTTPATETTAGTKTYKCTECGYVIKTETIPATGTGDKPTPPAPWVPHPGVSAPVVPTTGANNSSLPTVNGQNGWEAVSAEITTSSDGDKILVEMNSATKVPSTLLGDLEGKDVDVVFNMGRGITWTVNGLSITSRKTIDFDISKNTRHIPDEVVDNAEGSHKKQISLDHKGTFGCTAALTYEVGTKYNGLYANLFYYNPKTEQLEFADCSLVSGGKAKFTFTHASDYLITISDEPLGEFEDVSSAAGIASDSSVIVNETAIGAVLAVIVLGFGIIVYRKRRHN